MSVDFKVGVRFHSQLMLCYSEFASVNFAMLCLLWSALVQVQGSAEPGPSPRRGTCKDVYSVLLSWGPVRHIRFWVCCWLQLPITQPRSGSLPLPLPLPCKGTAMSWNGMAKHS